MNPKVLIAGAGPVGLTLAVELTRFGVPVRIVEKSPHRTDKSKAIAIWSRSLELLERAELSQKLIGSGIKVIAANISTGIERVVRISLEHLDTPYSFALMIPQSDTERILEADLLARGVTVERQVELKGFSDLGSSIEATVERADGTSETILADWLVGCDGAHSTVRHALGMEFRGDTIPEEFVLADIRLAGAVQAPDELATFWHEKGVVVAFPLPGGRVRLIASMNELAAADAAEPTLAEIQAIIDERVPGGVVASDPVWIARFSINERKVDHYRSGQVFVAGDAAHIHSPAGGQGMNTGMQDAINLSWKLALVCYGTCSTGILDSYSRERSPVAAKVLADAGRLTKVAMLRNPVAQAARNFVARHLLGLHAVQQAAGETLAELAIGYPESPMNGDYAEGLKGPLPGHRLRPGAGSPVGAGDRPRFAVFAEDETGGGAALMAAHPELLEDNLRPPVDPEGIWLVRPDGYVALSAGRGDWQAVTDYLDLLKSGVIGQTDDSGL